MKKIGIIGSRRRDDREDKLAIWNEFKKWYEKGDIIVSGGCPKGGDRFAEEFAVILGLTEENGRLIIHRPKPIPKGSSKYDYMKAFYERNTLVAKDADVLIACVSPDRKGGTEDTIKKFLKFGKDPIFLVII